jgi:putative ABC transport system substrate-binding protein
MGVSSDPVGFGLIKSLAKTWRKYYRRAIPSDRSCRKGASNCSRRQCPKLISVAVLSNFALPATQKGLEETEIAARKLGVSRAIVWRQRGVRHSRIGVRHHPPRSAGRARRLSRTLLPAGTVRASPRSGEETDCSRLEVACSIVDDGGLLSYGASFTEGWRLAARYVDKVLKGAKPADLPVEQPTTFELAINLNTCEELDLTLPASLLRRANDGDSVTAMRPTWSLSRVRHSRDAQPCVQPDGTACALQLGKHQHIPPVSLNVRPCCHV